MKHKFNQGPLNHFPNSILCFFGGSGRSQVDVRRSLRHVVWETLRDLLIDAELLHAASLNVTRFMH